MIEIQYCKFVNMESYNLQKNLCKYFTNFDEALKFAIEQGNNFLNSNNKEIEIKFKENKINELKKHYNIA